MDVLKGAAGARYGADAIGGVLLIEPPPLLREPGLHGQAQLIGALNGRRGTVAARLDGAHAWLDGFAWRVEGNLSKGAALETPGYPLDNTGIVEWNLGATAAYERDDLTFKLTYRHNDLLNGVCSCVRKGSAADFLAQLDSDRPAGAALYDVDYDVQRPYQSVTHDLVLARGSAAWPGIGKLVATYAFQNNHRQEFEVVRQAIEGPQFDFTLRTHSLDVSWDHAPPTVAPGWVLTGTLGAAGSLQENVFTGLPLIPNYRSYGGGVFGIGRLITNDFELSVGARYDHLTRDTYLDREAYSRHVGRGTIARDACADTGDARRCLDGFNIGSVSVGGVWRPREGVSAKLDLSSASRLPTIDEQYINGTAPTLPVLAVGDPALGPETAWSGSVTIDLDEERVSASVSGYATYIDDYIYFAPEIRPDGTPIFDVLIRGTFPRFGYTAVNAIFYGGEANVTLHAGPIDVAGQMSVVRARDVQNDRYLVYIPPDRQGMSITYRAPELWRLSKTFFSVSGTWVARQSRFERAADLTTPPGGYFLLGASAGTEIHVGGQRLWASIEGDNLLDSAYRDYTSLLRYFAHEPGRQVFLRLGGEVDL